MNCRDGFNPFSRAKLASVTAGHGGREREVNLAGAAVAHHAEGLLENGRFSKPTEKTNRPFSKTKESGTFKKTFKMLLHLQFKTVRKNSWLRRVVYYRSTFHINNISKVCFYFYFLGVL